MRRGLKKPRGSAGATEARGLTSDDEDMVTKLWIRTDDLNIWLDTKQSRSHMHQIYTARHIQAPKNMLELTRNRLSGVDTKHMYHDKRNNVGYEMAARTVHHDIYIYI